ncbi:class I SAM-dependent methyltransferase [Candidatus Woesearchaeota archaeon]|nr:class I SAM-dependent methyltransferase [Candidatus Woesearchaeota archaeon]
MSEHYYDIISDSYHELYKEEQGQKIALVLSMVKLEGSILDVGAGPCYLSSFVDSKHIVALDPSEKLLKMAKNCKTVVGYAESIPFDDDTFDNVVSFTAIQNFKDVKKGLEEMKRVGKKQFVFTFVKDSPKRERIIFYVKELFKVDRIIEDDKDVIIIAKK